MLAKGIVHLVVWCLFAAGITGPSNASPLLEPTDPPPRVTLVNGDLQQDGMLGSRCWSQSNRPYTCARFPWRFPPAQELQQGELVLRIDKRMPPTDYQVVAWHDLNHRGEPAGRRERFDVTLRPADLGPDAPAWELLFDVEGGPARHLFIAADIYWLDDDGLPSEEGAIWTFHVTVPEN